MIPNYEHDWETLLVSSKSKKLLEAALELPPAEREALAGRLFDSLEESDPDAEAAWQTEIEKRIEELDQGKVKPLKWSQARRIIFGGTDDPPKS
jgi:putative addiction module component (TIGR02574 family)